MLMHVLLLGTVAVALHGQSGPSAERPEISARHWFNNPPYRLHDDRRVVLLFFRTERPGRELLHTVALLERVARRQDAVVIGLTPDSRARAQDFIEKQRVRFTIGAESRCARDFGVEEYPALRLIDARNRGSAATVDPAWLDQLAGEAPEPEPQDRDAWLGALRSGADADARRAAVRQLFEILPVEEFVALADELIAVESNPFVRGELRYRRALALGEDRTDDRQTRSAAAMRGFIQNPEDPQWAPVRKYLAERTPAPPIPMLLDDYLARIDSDAPAEVLTRRMIVERLLGASADRAGALEALRQIVSIDVDPSIRLVATMKLGELSPTGDFETAGLLDELARLEPNELRVRSMMEYVANLIRAGDEDASRVPRASAGP
jgi:hypothetical protein